MCRLEELWLGDNPIGSGSTVEVTKALCGNRVKKLSLTNTGIGEPDCEALCELLNSGFFVFCLFLYTSSVHTSKKKSTWEIAT